MQNTKQKGKKKSNLIDRLKRKKRFIVINDETLEERFSLNLTASQIIIWTSFSLLLVSGIIFSLIAFTPLREFIPGYTDTEVRAQAAYAAFKVDSLEGQLKTKSKFINNLKQIMEGATRYDEERQQEIKTDNTVIHSFSLKSNSGGSLYRSLFLTPLKGLVSSEFNINKEHFGVDIIAPKNEVIKATSNGTVILATWTSETGYVIQIQHDNDLISVYKHNSILLKDVGERVRLGDAIAVVGDSGELTSGPHLHFELWHKGRPIDPQELMTF